jgi:flavin reductase (DIM6/NTAB) family NADH-FMN oxidoreductase RutF
MGSTFTVNILDNTQTDMIAHFGKSFKQGASAFGGLQIEQNDEAGPVLSEALAFLKCRVAGRYPAGDHDVVIGTVLRGAMLSDGVPMIHIRKNGMHY